MVPVYLTNRSNCALIISDSPDMISLDWICNSIPRYVKEKGKSPRVDEEVEGGYRERGRNK